MECPCLKREGSMPGGRLADGLDSARYQQDPSGDGHHAGLRRVNVNCVSNVES